MQESKLGRHSQSDPVTLVAQGKSGWPETVAWAVACRCLDLLAACWRLLGMRRHRREAHREEGKGDPNHARKLGELFVFGEKKASRKRRGTWGASLAVASQSTTDVAAFVAL